jgi:hypothetical protein
LHSSFSFLLLLILFRTKKKKIQENLHFRSRRRSIKCLVRLRQHMIYERNERLNWAIISSFKVWRTRTKLSDVRFKSSEFFLVEEKSS